LSISHTQATIDAIGSSGTPGARKPRSKSGRVRRSTMTPAETRAKANSVPMLTISSSLSIGNTDAGIATSTPTSTVIRTGVPCGPVLANGRGSNPSRHIAKSTRVCPSTSTITTVVRPASAPIEITLAAQSIPLAVNAVARLASSPALRSSV
jgi:hypothetical protein